jgi:hypothetical protein
MFAPHLPVEIHNIISSHLAREDLPSYRSASKRLADIGAQYLFRRLAFHASYASLDRIKNVGKNDNLARLVESVTWDTSSLCLDVWDSNEWKNRILGLRRRELGALRKTWHAQNENDDAFQQYVQWYLWEQYERYTKLVAEERELQAPQLADITKLLAPFPKLKTIILEKKQYEFDEATVQALGSQSNELIHRGMLHRHTRVSYKHFTDMSPVIAALNAAQSFTRHLEARTLHFSIFSPPEYTKHLQQVQVSQITRLHLRFALLDASSNAMESSLNIMNCKHVLHQGLLRTFLRKFSSLQSLELDFEARSLGNGRAPVNLDDVFPPEQNCVWPHLQHLAICHADTPASTMTALLASHAPSLKSLSLGDMCLDPPASWESILTDLQPTLSLSSAAFSYFLFDARSESFLRGRSAMLGWYCDSEACMELNNDLGARLEKFMVKGGVCPLSEERKITRVVGRLEDGRLEDWAGGQRASVIT